MAMSLRSTQKEKKWYWNKIYTEHFYATANFVGFSSSDMKQVIEQICDTMQETIDSVATTLTKQIDENVRDQIFTGVIKQVQKVSMK